MGGLGCPEGPGETGTIVPISCFFDSKTAESERTFRKMMGRRGEEAGVTPEEIGNALKIRRKEYQLRQEEVAEFARVSERFVREVEKGKQTVRLDKLIDVLTAVGLELVATDRVPEQLKPFKG